MKLFQIFSKFIKIIYKIDFTMKFSLIYHNVELILQLDSQMYSQ